MSRSTVTPAIVIRAALSVLVLSGFGSVVYVLLRSVGSDISPNVREILMFLFGVLATQVNTVIGYWFGSSQGSAEKSAEISKAPPPSMTIGGNTTNNNAKDTP